MMTLPVVVDVESMVPVVDSEVVTVVPETDTFVADTDDNVDKPDIEIVFAFIDDNVVFPATFKIVPMYRLFDIPTPPPMTTLPVIEEVASVVPVVAIDVAVKDPETVIAVAVIVTNEVIPMTFKLDPM